MALAWKAGWVQALRGSNPLSSAIPYPPPLAFNQLEIRLEFLSFYLNF